MRNAFGSWKPVLALCAAGVGLRLVFLALTTNLDLLRDEGHYVYLALSWNRFGFYPDGLRYLWPPGFPLFLAWCLSLFGAQGVVAAKLVQVLASASIGICTMALAERLFGARGALIAGGLWCVHLPLIGYTHTLWSETLFLVVRHSAGDRALYRSTDAGRSFELLVERRPPSIAGKLDDLHESST